MNLSSVHEKNRTCVLNLGKVTIISHKKRGGYIGELAVYGLFHMRTAEINQLFC